MNTPIDRSFISIVPLGGRHVNHFWRLLGQLGIPHFTILDLDRERDGGGWGRIKYVIKQLISIGNSKDELLNFILPSGIPINVTEEQLETMHTWSMTPDSINVMNQWIIWLRRYGVVFSAPLDIDFMMLKAFPGIYQQATEGTGPRIPDRISDPFRWQQRIAAATAATLKDAGGDGGTYSAEERELFIWYSYLFLGRGKPVTHLLALNELDNQTLLNNLPEPIMTLMNSVVTYLGRR